jgi:hypothetical protein
MTTATFLLRFRPIFSQTNTVSLHCGVWGVDCVPPQAYNVSVIMVACER